MAPYIVLISGANRGLGKGFLELYLAKPNHIVIAANRNPDHPTSKTLFDLPTGVGSKLIVVKVDASVEEDAFEAVKALEKQGVEHLDLVIANAGVAYIWPKVSELKIKDLLGHLEPNVFGVVWLYQATLPLLLKAREPKLVTIGSAAGWLESVNSSSIHTLRFQARFLHFPIFSLPNNQIADALRNQLDMPNAAYATSKVAVHWLTKRMNGEEEKLTAFVISPGWCQTDLGNTGARYFGMEEAPLEVEESCRGMVKLIEKANKKEYGGKLWGYEGDVQSW